MPTYKHPCPSCDRFIQRDVAACPYCGVRDPFAPRRCASCRAPLDDPSWIACPRCGAATGRPASPAAAPAAGTTPIVASATPAPPAATTAPMASPPAPAEPPAPVRACSGCAAPLPEGARFCTVCGTLAD